MKLLHFWLIAVSFLFVSVSKADTYLAINDGFTNGATATVYSTLSATCASITQSGTWIPLSPNQCRRTDNFGNVTTFTMVTHYACPGGGTLSGTNCIDAPACPAPQIRDVTGLCSDPPVICTAGDQKILYVPDGTYPDSGTAPTFNFGQINRPVQNRITVNQGGCLYELPLSHNHIAGGCQVGLTGTMFCKYLATATGQGFSGEDSALDEASMNPQTQSNCKPPNVWEVDHCAVSEATPGCYRTSKGDEVCVNSNQLNCGKFNGLDVCVTDKGLTSGGYPVTVIDGIPVATKQNENGQFDNCVLGKNGKTVCVDLPVVPASSCGGVFACVKTEQIPNVVNNTPPVVSFGKDAQEVSKTATTNHPDGSRTETTTITNNYAGSTSSVVTNNYDSAGKLTDSTTKKDDSVGQGGQGNTNVSAPDTSGLDGIINSLTNSLSNSQIGAGDFISSFWTLPASGSCQTILMHFKALNYTLDPCAKLALFRAMFGWLLYIITGFYLYQIAIGKH